MTDSNQNQLTFFIRKNDGALVEVSDIEERNGYGIYAVGQKFIGFINLKFLHSGPDFGIVAPTDGVLSCFPDEPHYSSIEEAEFTGIVSFLINSIDEGTDNFNEISDPITLFILPAPKIKFTDLEIEYFRLSNLDKDTVVDLLTSTRSELNNKSLLETSMRLDRNYPLYETIAGYDEKWKKFQFLLFKELNIHIPIEKGTSIGSPAPSRVVSGDWDIEFHVIGESGPVDPTFFYVHCQDLLEENERDLLDQLLRQAKLSPNGIYFTAGECYSRANLPADIQVNSIAPFETYIYPYWFLKIIKARIDEFSVTWEQIGRAQIKAYHRQLGDLFQCYKTTLRANADATDDELIESINDCVTSNPALDPFEFNDSDWKNIFQLQAIAEFFLNYPTPRDVSTSPVLPGDPQYNSNDPSTYEKVDLLNHVTLTYGSDPLEPDTDLFLVQIDNFALVGGTLDPKVNKGMDQDRYEGMMFIIKNGEINDKYQFSSFTSKHNPTPLPNDSDKKQRDKKQIRGSIEGNKVYGFLSATSGSKRTINYSFLVTDRDNLANPYLSGAQYFFDDCDVTIDLDQGITTYSAPKVPGYPPHNPHTKKAIMIHYGWWPKNGSHGCQVSRAFFKFRRTIINLMLDDNTWKERIGTDRKDFMKLAAALSWREGAEIYDHGVSVYDVSLAGGGQSIGEMSESLMFYMLDLMQERHPDFETPEGKLIADLKRELREDPVKRAEWDRKIFGLYYLIHPGQIKMSD